MIFKYSTKPWPSHQIHQPAATTKQRGKQMDNPDSYPQLTGSETSNPISTTFFTEPDCIACYDRGWFFKNPLAVGCTEKEPCPHCQPQPEQPNE